LVCFGCTGHPTPEEQALVSKVESQVRLPKGGGELKCYERYYALLAGKELDAYMGVPLIGLAGRNVLIGEYRRGSRPGVHWASSATELPPKIMDGGCDDMTVFHVVGDQEPSIKAFCSTTIAGVPPDEISPPVTC
jgi:hypothetical protein